MALNQLIALVASMMFFNKKSKAKFPKLPKPSKSKQTSLPLPANWPSLLHNKCNNPQCRFPNPPQAVEGQYGCLGISGGFYCEGVYYVSAKSAEAVVRKHKEEIRREEEDRRILALAAEAERQNILKYEREEAGRRQAAEELARRYEAEHRMRDAPRWIHRGHEHASSSRYHEQHHHHQQSPHPYLSQSLERRVNQNKRQDDHHFIRDPRVFEYPREVPRPPVTVTHQVNAYHAAPQFHHAPQAPHPSQAMPQMPPPRGPREHRHAYPKPSRSW
ncbi:hypothetical protein BDQ12DRAFT_734411 [Crucibulum laeve]|uniref:Uncharacterized protein n=1 Tax=Crucibulum laeve TaxID=68775 RepID=A0A5C3M547_9AGAR|nr:hypothetical protein BDQ12DRAFT_734411 [Crucibulum laeve]